MKSKIFLAAFLALVPIMVGAESYSESLKRTPTNHFQLLLNNLNMFFLNSIASKADDNEADISKPRQRLIKFFESKHGNIVADAFYQAPVSMVSSTKCKEIATEAINEIKGGNSDLAALLMTVSYYDMKPHQAAEIVSGLAVNVTMQAIENKELSISCSNQS